MAVTHGHQPDCNRRSDGVRHARSGRARFATRIKKRACGDIASHAPRLMAVCDECLRVWTVPAESHLVLENNARDSLFGKSRVSERHRAVAGPGNDAKHLVNAVGDSPSIQRGQLGRQSRDVQKSARVWRVDCNVRGCAPCPLWPNAGHPWSPTRLQSPLRRGPARAIRSRTIRGPD